MSNHEPGYRPMLVWAHTKIALQEIRQKLSDSHSCQERWLITAAAELVLSHPELHQEWINAALQLDERENHSLTTCRRAPPHVLWRKWSPAPETLRTPCRAK